MQGILIFSKVNHFIQSGRYKTLCLERYGKTRIGETSGRALLHGDGGLRYCRLLIGRKEEDQSGTTRALFADLILTC